MHDYGTTCREAKCVRGKRKNQVPRRVILGLSTAIVFQAIPGIFGFFGPSGPLMSMFPVPSRGLAGGDIISLPEKFFTPYVITEPRFQPRVFRIHRGGYSRISCFSPVPRTPPFRMKSLFSAMAFDAASVKRPDAGIQTAVNPQARTEAWAPIDYTGRPSEFRINPAGDFVSVHDFDINEHMAMLVRNPTKIHDYQGYIHIPAGVWGAQLKPDILSSGRALASLGAAIRNYAGITIKIDRFTNIHSPCLFRYPFLYITADDLFTLTESEKGNLRSYFRHGGFALIEPYGVFADSTRTPRAFGPVRQLISDIFGGQCKLSPIPGNHELYRCFFDTAISDGSPIPFKDILAPHQQPRTCLEGIFINGRLALVYSEKRYGAQWDAMNKIQPGINILVYALLSGGMTRPEAWQEKNANLQF